MPKPLEVMGETETKIHCQATVCRACVLAVPLTIKVGVTKFGIEASTETFCVSCICYQFRANDQTCGHRPQYKDDDTVEIFVCAKKKGQVSAGWLLLPQRYGKEDSLQNQSAMSTSRFSCSSMGRRLIVCGPVT